MTLNITEQQAGTRDGSGRFTLCPALPAACPTCPFRLANQERPPLDNPKATMAEWYWVETLQRAWDAWGREGVGLADGLPGLCHQRDGAPIRHCAGIAGMQQRDALRFVEADKDPAALGSLRSLDAMRRVVGRMLGFEPEAIDDEWVIGRLEIDLDELLEAANPTLVDLAIGCDGIAPLTDAERQRWNRPPLGELYRERLADGLTYLDSFA